MTIWDTKRSEKTIGITPYLNDSYEKFKSYERFRFAKGIITEKICKAKTLLDIGCAKGEFIWYLKNSFPDVKYTGVDISKKLISLARKEPLLKDEAFIAADAGSFALKKKFDIVLMFGLLSYFDDIKQPLGQILRHLAPGGWGYIFGCFMENDADVLIRYRDNLSQPGVWRQGLNMFSLNTVKKELRPLADKIRFHKFNLSMDIKKDNADPTRSYTLHTVERGKLIATGLNIILDLYMVEFMKKPQTRNGKGAHLPQDIIASHLLNPNKKFILKGAPLKWSLINRQ